MKHVGADSIYGFLPGTNPNENIYKNIKRRPKPIDDKIKTKPAFPNIDEHFKKIFYVEVIDADADKIKIETLLPILLDILEKY